MSSVFDFVLDVLDIARIVGSGGGGGGCDGCGGVLGGLLVDFTGAFPGACTSACDCGRGGALCSGGGGGGSDFDGGRPLAFAGGGGGGGRKSGCEGLRPSGTTLAPAGSGTLVGIATSLRDGTSLRDTSGVSECARSIVGGFPAGKGNGAPFS